MSNSPLIQVPRQSDRAILKCFRKLASDFSITPITIVGVGFQNSKNVNLLAPDEFVTLLDKKNSILIDRVSTHKDGLSITFYRGGRAYHNGQTQQKSPHYDEIAFDVGNAAMPQSTQLEIAALVADTLNAYSPGRTAGGISPEQNELQAIHTATLERLQSLNEDLIKTTHEYRNEVDGKRQVDIERIKNEYAEKEQQLVHEHKQKLNALQEAQAELEELRKSLDDRNNTHARREIRRDILKEIKKRQTEFKLTTGTRQLRMPVHFALGLLAIFFAFMAVFTANEFFRILEGGDLTKIVISGIKQTLYSAGAVGTMVFAIRWMNRWFEQHAQAEFQLKQFELDMERASWLVETSLEWKDAKGTAIPPELLNSLSIGLFASPKDHPEPALHPVDQLASAILGTASVAKLKVGDSVIEIDPKKLAKAKPIDPSD